MIAFRFRIWSVWVGLVFFPLVGCDWMPGKPTAKNLWESPEADLDFYSLYTTNCIACHAGPTGVSSSISLANSVYLSLISPEKMHKIIASGVPGTAMPAFSEKNGGRLTEAQMDVLVKGIYGWRDPKKVSAGPLPPYSVSAGDPVRGAKVFSVYCANCHGVEGTGGKAGSVVDSAYLELVTDQYLRTVIIAGRPEIGHPNWRELAKPMPDQDIADVVAWLIAHRGVNRGILPIEMRR